LPAVIGLTGGTPSPTPPRSPAGEPEQGQQDQALINRYSPIPTGFFPATAGCLPAAGVSREPPAPRTTPRQRPQRYLRRFFRVFNLFLIGKFRLNKTAPVSTGEETTARRPPPPRRSCRARRAPRGAGTAFTTRSPT